MKTKMTTHHFDTRIAKEVGITAAVIFSNIKHWVEYHEANDQNLHEGHYWTYNSVVSFERIFDYLTKSQIRVALEKLEKVGLIKVGNFNKSPYDRTKWYTVLSERLPENSKCICEKSQMDMQENTNQFAKNHKPIPDINTNINTDIKQKINKKEIDEIYLAYPSKCPVKGTSTGKGNSSKKKIEKLLREHSKEYLIQVIRQYISESEKAGRWIKNFNTFLNNLPEPFFLDSVVIYRVEGLPQSSSYRQYLLDKEKYESVVLDKNSAELVAKWTSK